MATAAVVFLIWNYYRIYPHGRDPCCDKQLLLALLNYADQNGGRLPTGGATPEASLGLLYPALLDANVLRGKTYPEAPAQLLLEAGQPLTPATCGWEYVDGLTIQPTGQNRVALFWDKFGSGHNSEALPFSGHTVMFMDGHTEIIATDDWAQFLADCAKPAFSRRPAES